VPKYYEQKDGVLKLFVYVQPGARKSELVGIHGDRIKIKLKAPPVDGKANDALLEFICDWLKVSISQVILTAGLRDRRKTIEIRGEVAQAQLTITQLR
jgi:uncharacterized protein (TIGR00251 family)